MEDALMAEEMLNPPGFPKVIGSTMLNSFRACPRQFYWTYIRRQIPQLQSVHLLAGGAFAKAIDTGRMSFFQHGSTNEEALIKALRTLWVEYGDFETDTAKTALRMAGALIFYFDSYPFDKEQMKPIYFSDRAAVEFSFAVPSKVMHPETGEPIILGGRADAIVGYRDALFCIDEKTTGQLGDTWANKWGLRAQFMQYTWSARQYGFDVQGTIIRGIAIYKTKYATAEAIIYHPTYLIDEWEAQTTRDLHAMVACYDEDMRREKWGVNFGDSCTQYSGCDYRRLCGSPNPEIWLENYYRHNDWGSLNPKKEPTV